MNDDYKIAQYQRSPEYMALLARRRERSRLKQKPFTGPTFADTWPVLASLYEVRARFFTVPEMAERMKVSRQVVARLERSLELAEEDAAFRKPSLELVQRYASALGLSVRIAICLEDGASTELIRHCPPGRNYMSPRPRRPRLRFR